MEQRHDARYQRLLALDPCTRGFGFAVLEERGRLVDWGVARLRSGSEAEFVMRVAVMIERYQPRAVVLEELGARYMESRRGRCVGVTEEVVVLRKIGLIRISRGAVREKLGGCGRTRYEIAHTIGDFFPELRPQLPEKRKLWKSENERMNVFDAVSFALTAMMTG